MIDITKTDVPSNEREEEALDHLRLIEIAAQDHQLGLIETTTKDGKPVFVLVADRLHNGEQRLFILARLFMGDPEDEVVPPLGLTTKRGKDTVH